MDAAGAQGVEGFPIAFLSMEGAIRTTTMPRFMESNVLSRAAGRDYALGARRGIQGGYCRRCGPGMEHEAALEASAGGPTCVLASLFGAFPAADPVAAHDFHRTLGIAGLDSVQDGGVVRERTPCDAGAPEG